MVNILPIKVGLGPSAESRAPIGKKQVPLLAKNEGAENYFQNLGKGFKNNQLGKGTSMRLGKGIPLRLGKGILPEEGDPHYFELANVK